MINKFLIFLSIFLSDTFYCQEKKDTVLDLWEGGVKTEILDEIVFIPMSKNEIKDIVKKISNSIEKNYKKDDFIFMNYEEKIVANDSIENNLEGKFGVLIPNYQDINIQDIEIAKVFDIENVKNVGVEQAINALSAPFMVPTMGFVLPIISIEDAPFIENISDYKYSGWSDQNYYVISFEPENKKDSYKFCGKIVINKEDFVVINISYNLCTTENIMKMKDLPYVSNKTSFGQKLKFKTAMLFMSSMRKFSNNLVCNTFYWNTDIGYKKDTISGKYTLDYLTVNSSSIVKGVMEDDLLQKIKNKKARESLEGKKYIDVIQKYRLKVSTSHKSFIPKKQDSYMNTMYYYVNEEKDTKKQERGFKKGGVKDYYEKIENLEVSYQKTLK